jgi:hypothetical protein
MIGSQTRLYIFYLSTRAACPAPANPFDHKMGVSPSPLLFYDFWWLFACIYATFSVVSRCTFTKV